MKSNQFSIGMVVEVLCGRDQGKLMMVQSIVDETYVRLVDGVGRTLDKPKLKKVKHLKDTGEILDGIAVKLTTGMPVFDAEIRSAIRHSINKLNDGGHNV